MKPNNKVIVDKARLFRRVIILSWIALVLCFVIKIFGGNFFEIMCENPNYKALCEYADSHFWAKLFIGFISSMVCEFLYILSILQKFKPTKKDFIITTASVFISCFCQMTIGKWSIITDIWLMVGLPILLLGKNYKKYWQVLVAWCLTFLFQVISLLVKNFALKQIDESTFISLIYSIDVYLMCALYYLYRNYLKEYNNMGVFWVMFMGKPDDKLVAMKEKREKKIAKLKEKETKFQSEVNAIVIELSKRKDEK